MNLSVTHFPKVLDSNNTLMKKAFDSTSSLVTMNDKDNFSELGSSGILNISNSVVKIGKAESFIARSEIVASDFETASNTLNRVSEAVVELNSALEMSDEMQEKNQVLSIASDKLINSIAHALSTPGQNGKNLFSGNVNLNNLRTVSNFNAADNTASTAYMNVASSDDFVALSEGDQTNITIMPENFKDLVGAAHEVKRLADNSLAVPAAVSNLFRSGESKLNSMMGNVKIIYDKAKASVKQHTTDIGATRDHLKNTLGADHDKITRDIADQRNIAEIVQAIYSMTINFNSTLIKMAMNF